MKTIEKEFKPGRILMVDGDPLYCSYRVKEDAAQRQLLFTHYFINLLSGEMVRINKYRKPEYIFENLSCFLGY